MRISEISEPPFLLKHYSQQPRWESTHMTTNRWMEKENTYYDMLFSLKKRKKSPFMTMWMNLVESLLNKISQLQGDKGCCSTYMRYLKQSDAQEQRAWSGACQGLEVGVGRWRIVKIFNILMIWRTFCHIFFLRLFGLTRFG